MSNENKYKRTLLSMSHGQHPHLGQGDKGEAVAAIQSFLNEKYLLSDQQIPVNGHFTAETEEAIRKYQLGHLIHDKYPEAPKEKLGKLDWETLEVMITRDSFDLDAYKAKTKAPPHTAEHTDKPHHTEKHAFKTHESHHISTEKPKTHAHEVIERISFDMAKVQNYLNRVLTYSDAKGHAINEPLLEIDGIQGTKTTQHIKDYQRLHGLDRTGIIDTRTLMTMQQGGADQSDENFDLQIETAFVKGSHPKLEQHLKALQEATKTAKHHGVKHVHDDEDMVKPDATPPKTPKKDKLHMGKYNIG